MSQAGIVDIEGSHPQIPTLFVANVGSAIPIANTIEILGTAVAAHSVPLQTVGSGNTISIDVQYASAAASSIANNAGVASFNSSQFSVDANGYVSFSGGAVSESFTVDTFTAPGTNPVVPNGSGTITITGGQVAAGTTTNVIRTDSLAANTYTIQIQRSQAVGSSTVGDNGVSHFNSTYFTVDANGFVSINGAAIGETITGNTGGALSPTAGNWNILGTSTAAGTTPVQTAGSVSTLTVQVQKSQAIASTDATKVGLAAFDSARFSVDANGFVTLNGGGVAETITGNSGGALSPTAGNWNIVGTGSITTSGSVSTLTVQLTGLTNHNVQVGAGTATLTQVSPSATAGIPLVSNGSSSDPSFTTAVVAGGGTGATSFNINGAVYSNTTTTGILQAATLTSGQLLIGGTTTPAAATLTAGAGIIVINGNNSITIAATGAGFTWSDTSGTVTAVAENGYFITGATTSTLPASPSEGDTIKYIVDTSSALTITANTGQKIRLGNTLSAAAGTCVNSQQGDSIELVYRSTGTTWFAMNSPVGAWTTT